MGEVLDSFIVGSTPVQCISPIPCFDGDDPDVVASAFIIAVICIYIPVVQYILYHVSYVHTYIPCDDVTVYNAQVVYPVYTPGYTIPGGISTVTSSLVYNI